MSDTQDIKIVRADGSKVSFNDVKRLIHYKDNIGKYAEAYRLKGGDENDLYTSVSLILDGLSNGSIKDVIGEFEGPANLPIVPMAVTLVKKALSNATPIADPEKLPYDYDIFFNSVNEVRPFKLDESGNYDFSDYAPGKLYNSDSGQETGKFFAKVIRNKVIPKLTTFDYSKKSPFTSLKDATDSWERMANAFETKGVNEESFLGNSDNKSLRSLGETNFNSFFEVIKGDTLSTRDKFIKQKKTEYLNMGFTEEDALKYANLDLEDYQLTVMKQRKDIEDKKEAEKYNKEYQLYVLNNWNKPLGSSVYYSIKDLDKSFEPLNDGRFDAKIHLKYLLSGKPNNELLTYWNNLLNGKNDISKLNAYVLNKIVNSTEPFKGWIHNNGLMFLPQSFNPSDGSVMVYDSSLKLFYRANYYSLKNEAINKIMSLYYHDNVKPFPNVKSSIQFTLNKKGGILKQMKILKKGD